MSYATKKWLRQIGVIFLIAAVFTVLPRVFAMGFFFLTRLVMTVAMFWILYKVLWPIIRNYINQRYPRGVAPRRKSHLRLVKKRDPQKRSQSRHSDRR